MRPLRIELEGIGSFRAPATLDLADAELFALSGPTGAGKTTLLVDAMVLALYGRVPRYDSRQRVAPVIHQGAAEGRVRLRFAVGGRTYTATRVIRRTANGATTKEAQLADITGGGERELARGRDEVTQAVERLVGLDFDQFCRTVVLPQGAFDRFLFADPSDRKNLLVQLLDLGLYERLGKQAWTVKTIAEAQADTAQRRLDGDLADLDPTGPDRLAGRIGALEALAQQCRYAQEQLDALREQGGVLNKVAEAAEERHQALLSLERPADVATLAERTRVVAAALDEAATARRAAAARLEAAETARAGLPDRALLDDVARAADELAHAETALPQLAEAAVAASRTHEAAEHTLAAASAAVVEARAALEDARRHEAVQTIAAELHAGDDCPVCGTTLAAAPEVAPGTATAAAVAHLADAEDGQGAADGARRATEREAVEATTRHGAAVAGQEAAAAALQAALAVLGVDGLDAATALRAQVEAADAELVAARGGDRAARTAEERARTDADDARAREAEAWAVLERARDRVAALGPPAIERGDLAAAWDRLFAWAGEVRPTVEREAAAAQEEIEAQRQRYRAIGRELTDACAGLQVVAASASAADAAVAVADELSATRARRDRLVEQLAEVGRVTAERDAAREEAQVALHLHRLLRTEGFLGWLLSRVLRRLAMGASAVLRELTSGNYSLALDDRNEFLVVDHRNADEPRTVRSLSGGERFLASLALALALAEHVAELAAEGAPRLESLFLDEGFGTLDPDTLDVVAAALEELGSRGRVVGIITHVQDLAERLPVRFEVRRGPDGSSVTRHGHDTPGPPDSGPPDGGPLDVDAIDVDLEAEAV